MRSYIPFCIVLAATATAHAQEAIEEAVPLDEFQISDAPMPAATTVPGKYAAYVLLEHRQTILDTDPWNSDKRNGLEGNVSGNVTVHGGFNLYGDVTSAYVWDEGNRWTLNQIGLHYFGDHWQGSLGRELSRKSPGLIVSPSDFIYTARSLPGARDQRQGVWQARAAYLDAGLSLEALYLPDLVLEEHGLPDARRSPSARAVRYFQQLPAFDLAVNYLQQDDRRSVGGFVQGYAGKSLKLYLDTASRQEAAADRVSTLWGASYEALRDFTARGELFYQNRDRIEPVATPWPASATALAAGGDFFIHHAYLIASLAWIDLWRQGSVICNYIGAMDYDQSLYMLRAELPLSSHQVMGLTTLYLPRLVADQDLHVAALDWKYAF